MANVKGKRVLLTGGASGIGFQAAREFARAGSRLILTDINAEALDRAANALREEHGADVSTHAYDVSDRAAVERMAAAVMAEGGAPDILINNAGIGHSGELAETGLDTWKKLVDVNFWGPLYHVYAFLPEMIRRGEGQIVNVSSGQAFFRLPTWGAYSTIKAALGTFSEILRFEVRKFGIAVTTVYPFMVNTPFYKDIEGDTFMSKLSMKLVPYYSMSPERVGRILFKAVKRKKAVEMVSILNDVGFYQHLSPPLAALIGHVSSAMLGKSADDIRSAMDDTINTSNKERDTWDASMTS